MSASTSSVVSPRKVKHTRSRGLTVSHSRTSSNDSISRFSTTHSALPAGIDPLTLDPDDAFVKLSVREVQKIEANLRSSHDSLSSKLRLLVSEKYRDMLGTANTLIEMSSSATNLVQRLDAVRQGVEKASSGGESRVMEVDQVKEEDVSQLDEERAKEAVFSLAAITKFLAESPDDVWRALDTASRSNLANSSTSKKALRGQDYINYKAATVLRAAWIYILCERAWGWLTSSLIGIEKEDSIDVASFFPYISKQWSSLAPMDSNIVNVAQAGLDGWYSATSDSGKRWEEISPTYTATITFFLSNALLEKTSITSARDLLLDRRKRAVETRLRQAGPNATQNLARLMSCVADTLVHCLRAFVLVEQGTELPHLANLYRLISKKQPGATEHEANFPPGAMQVLSTLPSSAIFTEHLPPDILHFAPDLNYDDSKHCQQSTIEAIRAWSLAIREEGKERAFADTINELKTVASIGEAQSRLWECFDRCVTVAGKVFQAEVTLSTVVEEELKSLAEVLDSLLLTRLNSLCLERAEELSRAVSEYLTPALQNNKEHDPSTEVEANPSRYIFTEGHPSDLEDRLRLRTPLIQHVLSFVEERAQSLSTEMDTYSTHLQLGAQKRTKRRQKRQGKNQVAQALSHQQDTISAQVIASFQEALNLARSRMVDELKRQRDGLNVDINVATGFSQALTLARVASALQHSDLLRADRDAPSAKGNDAFFQSLANFKKEVLDGYIARVTAKAIQLYITKISHCLDPRLDKQLRPTAALIESLLCLVDGIHSIGSGYLSDMITLGQQVSISYINAWKELSQKLNEEDDKRCYSFDSKVLAILFRDVEGAEITVRELGDLGRDIEKDKEGQIELSLQRIHLALIPLRRSHILNLVDKRAPTENASTPALPILPLIKGKEKIALLQV